MHVEMMQFDLEEIHLESFQDLKNLNLVPKIHYYWKQCCLSNYYFLLSNLLLSNLLLLVSLKNPNICLMDLNDVERCRSLSSMDQVRLKDSFLDLALMDLLDL